MLAVKSRITITIIKKYADSLLESLLYFQILPSENDLSVQCLRIKEKKPLFIWKGETITRSKNRRKNRLKMVMFDVEYVELEVLAGEVARWKCLLGS